MFPPLGVGWVFRKHLSGISLNGQKYLPAFATLEKEEDDEHSAMADDHGAAAAEEKHDEEENNGRKGKKSPNSQKKKTEKMFPPLGWDGFSRNIFPESHSTGENICLCFCNLPGEPFKLTLALSLLLSLSLSLSASSSASSSPKHIPMADGGLTVFDDSLLREATVSAGAIFSPSGDGDPTTIDGARLLSEAESVLSSLLLGLALPENLKAATLRRLGFDELSFQRLHLNQKSASEMLRKYVAAVADALRDDPLVVSVLDGGILRMLLEDEDDFAMLAENLFTELDKEDTGKLCKSETRNALAQMGVEMGVPSPSVSAKSDDLLDDILREHGAEGDELLGQAQFANLLQAVLQSLADALALKPIVVIQDIKVINGSKIRQILANEDLLLDTIDRIFDKQSASELDGGSIRKFKALLEKDGSEFGLPMAESNEALVLLYNQVFGCLDTKNGEELDKEAFGSALKQILQEILNQLESNPVFYEPEGN